MNVSGCPELQFQRPVYDHAQYLLRLSQPAPAVSTAPFSIVRTIILKAVFTFSEQTPAWSARSTAWSVPASAASDLATGIVSYLNQVLVYQPLLLQALSEDLHHLIRAQLT